MKKHSGFTIIEVLVTVAVGVILTSIAVPKLNNMMKSNRLTTTVNDFVYSLSITRSEAMKTGSASICVSSNQTNCTGGSWNQGWIVFSDANGDCNVDGTDLVVKVIDQLNTNINIGNSGVGTCITYGRSGFLTPAGTSATFNYCDDRTGAQAGRTVTVITSGRPSTDKYGLCPTV